MWLSIVSSFGTLVALAALVYEICIRRIDKRTEQANQVATWLEPNYAISSMEIVQAVVIENRSPFPIYEVVFSIDDLYDSQDSVGIGLDNCHCVDVLPNGKYVFITDFDGFGMSHVFNSSITFRDHYGKYWTRNARGVLKRHNGNNVIEKEREISRPYASVSYTKIS